VHFPKVITLEGQRSVAFAGEVDPDGEGTGFQLDLTVEGAVARVSASELLDGKVVAHEVHSIPVERSH
jgi:hypothetical protein